ncbi:hypothetical protein EVAR_41589_1 [Eumeta japonica]|uniref:Uncharacterized protein n=1 Tax=Eumeta variegata TaxID=151549 RepID=A0A4C1Y691_EUMVA|nr:hypothetical protein EVAR_41589_1 [Eumeta japonica]
MRFEGNELDRRATGARSTNLVFANDSWQIQGRFDVKHLLARLGGKINSNAVTANGITLSWRDAPTTAQLSLFL